jgi:hypothetical protein
MAFETEFDAEFLLSLAEKIRACRDEEAGQGHLLSRELRIALEEMRPLLLRAELDFEELPGVKPLIVIRPVGAYGPDRERGIEAYSLRMMARQLSHPGNLMLSVTLPPTVRDARQLIIRNLRELYEMQVDGETLARKKHAAVEASRRRREQEQYSEVLDEILKMAPAANLRHNDEEAFDELFDEVWSQVQSGGLSSSAAAGKFLDLLNRRKQWEKRRQEQERLSQAMPEHIEHIVNAVALATEENPRLTESQAVEVLMDRVIRCNWMTGEGRTLLAAEYIDPASVLGAARRARSHPMEAVGFRLLHEVLRSTQPSREKSLYGWWFFELAMQAAVTSQGLEFVPERIASQHRRAQQREQAKQLMQTFEPLIASRERGQLYGLFIDLVQAQVMGDRSLRLPASGRGAGGFVEFADWLRGDTDLPSDIREVLGVLIGFIQVKVPSLFVLPPNILDRLNDWREQGRTGNTLFKQLHKETGISDEIARLKREWESNPSEAEIRFVTYFVKRVRSIPLEDGDVPVALPELGRLDFSDFTTVLENGCQSGSHRIDPRIWGVIRAAFGFFRVEFHSA